jgi:hypothetical protein
MNMSGMGDFFLTPTVAKNPARKRAKTRKGMLREPGLRAKGREGILRQRK